MGLKCASKAQDELHMGQEDVKTMPRTLCL